MDFDKLIRFKSNWKSYGKDIAILTFLGFCILSFTDYITKQKYLAVPAYLTDSNNDFLKATVFFAFLVLLFLLVKVFFNWLFVRMRSGKIYKFSSQNWKKSWIFNGKTAPENTSDLKVEFSRAGCLLNRFFWKDFRMSFEAKYTHSIENFGVIFRAEDLNNYFMIEVAKSSINSRVRFSSGWEEVENFDHNISLTDFFSVVIEVKENTAWIYLNSKLVYTWILPSYVDVNHWEVGVKQDAENEIETKPIWQHVQKISFYDGPGKIGFRAHSSQGAIIRGLTVESL